ncbi:MAG: hypothetical protein WDM76_00160 [Limisphaerales bacterium]
MKIYWSLKNVPELLTLDSDERAKVHWACLREHFFYAPLMRWSVAAYLSFLVCPVAIVTVITLSYWMIGVVTPAWLSLLGTLFGSFIGMDIFSLIAINYLRRFYSAYSQRMKSDVTL